MRKLYTLGFAALGFARCGGDASTQTQTSVAAAGSSSEVATMSTSSMSAGGAAAMAMTAASSRTSDAATEANAPNTGAASSQAGASSPAARGGGGAPADMSATSADNSAGAGAMTGAADMSAAAGMTAAAGDSAAGAGAAAPAKDIPQPVSEPQVWGFGLGISDVPAATKFYEDVMQMEVEKDAIKHNDATETVMYSTQAMRGARISLMSFDDMRNTRKITAKLVFQAQNPSAVNTAARMHPDYVSRLNVGIVQFDGPDTYIHEVGSIFDTEAGSSISVPYPIAIGFAVSDQPASIEFYNALGMTDSSLGSFTVTDANGTGTIQEYTVKYTEGMGIVLQQWSPERNAKDNPVKVTLFVPDANAIAEKVMAAGGTIVKPAERTDLYDNRLLVVAKDLDGYVLDIVE